MIQNLPFAKKRWIRTGRITTAILLLLTARQLGMILKQCSGSTSSSTSTNTNSKNDYPPQTPVAGSQYTLTIHRPNGNVTRAVTSISSVHVKDLPEELVKDLLALTNASGTASATPVSAEATAAAGKEPLLQLLRAAGVTDLHPSVVALLPTWAHVVDLYGPMMMMRTGHDDTTDHACAAYRAAVPPSRRYLGVAGLYNTGTTAMAIYLQENVRLPQSRVNWTQVMEEYRGEHAWEVPWGKHRLYSLRNKEELFLNPGAENLRKDQVFPIVMVRDPYTWLHSMCTAPYMAKWPHDSTTAASNSTSSSSSHCPNLVANAQDVARFPLALKLGQRIPVRLPSQLGARFESLAHLYRDWYGQWATTTTSPSTSTSTGANKETNVSSATTPESVMPHMQVRFEDLIFRPEQVLERIRQCVGGTWKTDKSGTPSTKTTTGSSNDRTFVYVVGPAKWSHHFVKKQQQSTMISAMIKYGNGGTSVRHKQLLRLFNMTNDDIQLVDRTLEQLMRDFHYPPGGQVAWVV
jgi:hypothetical protein